MTTSPGEFVRGDTPPRTKQGHRDIIALKETGNSSLLPQTSGTSFATPRNGSQPVDLAMWCLHGGKPGSFRSNSNKILHEEKELEEEVEAKSGIWLGWQGLAGCTDSLSDKTYCRPGSASRC